MINIDYKKELIDQIKRQLKVALGIRSPSRQMINQLEKWETMSSQERKEKIKEQQKLEKELFGTTLYEIMLEEDENDR